MDLPSSRPEQIKLLIVVILAVTLTVLGVSQGVVLPLRRNKAAKLDRLKQCEEGLASVRRVMKFAPGDRKENAIALTEVSSISEKYLLQPVLGNSALSATELVEKHVNQLGLVLESINEIGITEIPHSKDSKEYADIKCYTSRVSLSCGYTDLVALLKSIESSNPYLCIVGMQISGAPDRDPEKHNVLFDVQWPIWADPEMPNQIKSELEEDTKQSHG